MSGAALLLAMLAGCASEPAIYRTSGPVRAPAPPTVVMYQDEYDYFPAYEVYYSRHRREYVYRDGRRYERKR